MTKHDHHLDEVFMQRALELATLGRGHVSPNPLVGSVIVHEGKIIGEGWHRKYGEAHAEVNAVNSVDNKSLLPESTVYVNLEPCSHFGKTPPCADMLIHHRVKKVVVANLDSNPLVSGEGVKKLRAAGIEVITGILDKQGHALNRAFFTVMNHQRPFIVLKWAETADGFIARENYDSKWISHALSRQLVHKWRTELDAILVGSKTAAHDNPQLNVRDWTGRNPVRVVIDRFLKLSSSLHVFDGSQKTIRYNVLKHEEHPNLSLVRLDEENFLAEIVKDLHRQKIQSVLVEGGAHLLQLFIDAGLWDEARIFQSPRSFGKGIAAPVLHGVQTGQYVLEPDTLRVVTPLATAPKKINQ
ncbi:bifunctional diaminohydroxyphosphoribosylaminopyrimidine deaminase/5-amino-6-(5-phosphoribosylamino)uracil reductase RibD [Chryseolinea lacunae]|uniref:Riboflavin biosynthesis protein RibD n=1 Tax=Chryseolinea lacunae TaxID=2801331 RepID=A0ABS1KS10_9BACT|nr:bifunctional diaminohydroxyphosphoribosylaminopyrimidine deaminase/5-amino-6-(5-phosphoribosylamino)uracil reductase RibD [Chryseolinea lacunae]MBL0742255.1 bifunctional diaminohydroxyphosphoribosylaminopyrimidine deaminase/5-amino-6-(5-phosphoribosylamino)uracil reductase RibD [Chryseolinea lacunae]